MNTLEPSGFVLSNDVNAFGKACNMVITPPGTFWPSEIVEPLKEGFACEQCARVTFGQLAANKRGLFMLRLSEWCRDDSCVVKMALQASKSMKLPLFVVLIPDAEIFGQTNELPLFAPFLRFMPDDCWISSFSFSPEDIYRSVREKIAVFYSSPKRVIHTRKGFCVLMVDFSESDYPDLGSNDENYYGSEQDRNMIDYPDSKRNYNSDQNACDNGLVIQNYQSIPVQATNFCITEDQYMIDYSGSKEQTTCDNVFATQTFQEAPAQGANTSLTLDAATACEETQHNGVSITMNTIPSYEGTYFEGANDGQNNTSGLDQEILNGLISSFDLPNFQENDELNVDEVLRELEANNEPNNNNQLNDAMNYSAQPNDKCNTTKFTNEQTELTENTNNDESDSTLMNEYTDYEAYMGSGQQPEQSSNTNNNDLYDSTYEYINETWNNSDFAESTQVYDLGESTDFSQFGLPTPAPEPSAATDFQNNDSTTSQRTNNESGSSLISPPLEDVLNNQPKHVLRSD